MESAKSSNGHLIRSELVLREEGIPFHADLLVEGVVVPPETYEKNDWAREL